MLLLPISLRALLHFWDSGMIHAFLVPAAFLVALLTQLFVIDREKRPWLPLAVCGGILVVCDIAATIAIVKLQRASLGVALIGMVVEMCLIAFLLGFAVGLLIGWIVRAARHPS